MKKVVKGKGYDVVLEKDPLGSNGFFICLRKTGGKGQGELSLSYCEKYQDALMEAHRALADPKKYLGSLK